MLKVLVASTVMFLLVEGAYAELTHPKARNWAAKAGVGCDTPVMPPSRFTAQLLFPKAVRNHPAKDI